MTSETYFVKVNVLMLRLLCNKLFHKFMAIHLVKILAVGGPADQATSIETYYCGEERKKKKCLKFTLTFLTLKVAEPEFQSSQAER